MQFPFFLPWFFFPTRILRKSNLWIIKSNDILTQHILPIIQNSSHTTQVPLRRKSSPFFIYVVWKEMELQLCNLKTCPFCLLLGVFDQSRACKTRLSTEVSFWEGRELFLWQWSSWGKMPRPAHPCVKHIAGITWHFCQQVKLLLMSAILALLEEA